MGSSAVLRTRWAAIGAAVAVTLGAGGIGITHAVTDSGERPVYLPIEPCRLAFTTPGEFQVGPRTGPLGPGEVETFDGWGSVGNCTLPSGTAGLALNVTALEATTLTNLRFYPADVAEPPTAANLNPAPDQPPTPNAVNVDLDGSGQFNVFNALGQVRIVIDVVGIYDDHTHDDRYYTKSQTYTQAEADAAIDARVPATDSIALAGGAFVPRGDLLVWRPGTACFANQTPANGLRHSIPVTAGSSIESIDIRVYGAGAVGDSFTVTVFSQPPGTTSGFTAAVESFTTTTELGLTEVTLDADPPLLADPGETLYAHFGTSSTDIYLCTMSVNFSRPG